MDNPAVVLVLSSDILQQDLIRLALKRNNLQSLACTNPMEVRERMTEQHPDLIVTDVYLPGKNGLELITELKNEGLLETTRFLVMSSLAFPEVVQKAMRLGAIDFLVKPLNIDLLINRVLRAVSAC